MKSETCCGCIDIQLGVIIIGVMTSIFDLPSSIILAIAFIVMLLHDKALTRLIFFIVYVGHYVLYTILYFAIYIPTWKAFFI